MGEMLGFREILEDLALLGGEDILGGSEMIRDKDNPIPVKDLLGSDLFEGFDRQGRRDIVPQGKVDPGIDEVTR